MLAAQALNDGALQFSLKFYDENDSSQKDIPSENLDEKLAEKIALKQIVKNLNEKDKAIIFLRFFKDQTQVKTAKALGMSQVQVSRREKVILKHIRKKFIS